jgi:predicted naringenin-chalcone synthase
MTQAIPHINRIGTAVPAHDVHAPFIVFARTLLQTERARSVFDRMAERSGISHRYSFLRAGEPGADKVDADGFFNRGRFPTTAARMERYERHAIDLALQAVAALDEDPKRFTHIVVASCTGFTAPGLDQQLAARLGMAPDIERTLIGFMGCYAAVNAMKAAFHIVRSDPEARVLVMNLELCTLHLQETPDLETVLSFMLFGDGCTATLVTAEPTGLALLDFRATTLPDSADLITWRIGDQGFDMRLSGKVPGRIAGALRTELERPDDGGLLRGQSTQQIDLWAVHAGGRTVLDAVEQGLRLGRDALRHSRAVLNDFGNMSSATIMFILDRMLRDDSITGSGAGFGMAFGPGLGAETFRFRRA